MFGASSELASVMEVGFNLVNLSMWLQTCNSAIYYYTGMLYLYNDIFLTDIIGYGRIKF